MKKRIFSMLLALCLMFSLLPTTALALNTTGTVVYNNSETGYGYLYVNGLNYAQFGPSFQLQRDPLKVGQTVYCQVSDNSEGGAVTSNEAYTFADDGDAMALNISGEARVEKELTITASRVPDVGTASVQLYRAADTATLFDDASKLGDAYTPSGAKTYAVQNVDLGYYIGAKLTYTVTVGETPYTTTLTAQTAQVAPVGGSCGENLIWELTGSEHNYALTISGTGAMTDYDFDRNMAPWLDASYLTGITSVTLDGDITHIGDYAFSVGGVAVGIQNITLPSTLISIGTAAFYNCLHSDSTVTLNLPSRLTTLGDNAFGACSGITEVILPAGLTTVGTSVFSRSASQPLTVYCLAGTAEALPEWANSALAGNGASACTVYGLTYHEAVEPTCVTAGALEYYSFDGSGVSETMAKRYYSAEGAYSLSPFTDPATELHTVDENGECTVCHHTFAASVTNDGFTKYFSDIPSAMAFPYANNGTITLLKNADALDLTGETQTCTVDLNGKTVTTLTGGDSAALTIKDTVGGGKVTNLVVNGTITLSGGTYDSITDNGGTLSLSADYLCRWEAGSSVKWGDLSTADAAGYEFTVLPIPVIITAQPTGGNVVPPATERELTVTFESHSSQPVTYEWIQILNEVETPIADNNSASYTATQAAKYYCIVTCDGYSAVSDVVTVTVTPALASVTEGDATTYYVSLLAALIAANEVPGSETVTVRALDNSKNTRWHDVILNRTAPIVLDLGGFTVTVNSGSDAVNLSVNGADLTVKNGMLVGYASDSTVQVKSGTLELESDLTLTNEESGGTTLEAIGGTVTVNGAVITNKNALSVIQSYDNSTLVINSGTFSTYILITNGKTTIINGGAFDGGIMVQKSNTTVADILGEGCFYRYTDGESSGLLVDPATAGTTIGPVTVEKPVVRIGNATYNSFDSAAAAAKTGETITLYQDTEAGSWTVSVDSVILDLNGHTLDFGSNNIEVGEGAALTVTDSSEGTTGRLIGSTTAPLISVAGTLLLESGSFENKDANGATIADKAGSRAVSAFLADGCCYYEGDDVNINTGAVLSTGTDASVSGSICVGKAAVAQVNVGGTITRYADLFDALTAANGKTATVTLLQDTIVPETAVQADKSLHLTEGTITLDLGGHTATLEQRGIWLTDPVKLTVQNGTLKGGPTYNQIVVVRGGAFTLAADATLQTVGAYVYALSVSNADKSPTCSATLHGTVTGMENYIVSATSDATLTVDGGRVDSLFLDNTATVELSGGSFGSIEADDVIVLKEALKTGYAYKGAGEEGKWVVPTSKYPSDTIVLSDVIVTPAPIQVSEWPAVNVTYVYGESLDLSVTATGVNLYDWNVFTANGATYTTTDDNTFTLPTDIMGIPETGLDVGEYNILLVLRGEDNWSINRNITVTVTPAKLTGVAVSQSGALSYTGEAQAAALTAAASSVLNQNVSFTFCTEENGEYTSAVPAFTEAGSHTVYYKAAAANHETATGAFTVTIAPAVLTDVSASQSGALTYSGAAQSAAVTTAATAVNEQSVSFTYCAAQNGEYTGAVPAFTKAGSYTVYYKAAAANHETATGSFTVTIGKRDLSITAKDQTITYGDLISQDVAQVNVVGLADGETLSSIMLTANALTVAEGATISPSAAAVSGGADNYNLSYNAGTLTVTPAELKAVSVAQNGALTYNKVAQTAKVTAAATSVNEQTVSFTYCAAEEGEYTSSVPEFTDAGEHTVYYKATAANHETATGSFTVTVDKATVTALDLTNLITAPLWNAERSTALSDQSQFIGEFDWTAENSKWEATGKFVKGEVYTANVAIRTTANYTFEGLTEESVFKYDGATSITQSEIVGDACTVTIVFKAVPGDTLLPEENLPEAVSNAGTFYVDGVPHNTSEFENGHIDLGTADRSNLVTYSYSGGENSYPTGMSVFSVESTEDGYTVTPVPELSNLLQYKGCSIRTSGVKGIRMITGIPDELRTQLIKAELDGCRLMEYGTVVAFSANMVDGRLTIEDSYAKHNYAYKRGVSDAVFGRADGLTQFTNVLVNFTPDQCKQELAMRPYLILEDADGNSQTIYGGIVYRSIGYIAWQNRDTYEAGTAEYRYIHDIIDHVYGENTPVE